MRVFDSVAAIEAAIGEHLGFSGWHEVDQARVSAFADVTGDHQWIHLDAERAARGPFGGTVAHGYLTLALIPMLAREIHRFEGFDMGVNYGLDRVRFPGVVRTGSRVRIGGEARSVEPAALGVRAVFRYTIEVEGSDKPGCVADAVVLLVGGSR